MLSLRTIALDRITDRPCVNVLFNTAIDVLRAWFFAQKRLTDLDSR
jgi:hypothetical protein